MNNRQQTIQAIKAPGVIAVVVLLLSALTVAYAATTAGTVIKNQASASYLDTFGVRRIATSNLVETLIRQVAAFELGSDQKKAGTAGQEVFFTHTLLNTGNGPDTFTLLVVDDVAADFKLANLNVYADDNRDGHPDSNQPLSVSHLLAPGESQNLVVGGLVPADAGNGSVGLVTLTAVSSFNSTLIESNRDAVLVTDAAVVEITKSISALSGSSPGGPLHITVQYKNPSAVTATEVTLIDALPNGMVYVPGSGRWSVTGVLGLTDSDPNDLQGGIRYCAYDGSCVGLPEALSDADSNSVNQVTAVIAEVQAGQSGSIEFEVSIASGLSTGAIYNTAELEYSDNGSLIGRLNSNSVPYTINRGVGVVINGSNSLSIDGTDEPRVLTESVFAASSNLPVCQSSAADPDGDGYGLENGAQCYVPNLQSGNAVYFRNTVWNLGNSTDSFDITTTLSSFPPGTVLRILQSDGQTPLLDSSGNGVADTGPVAVGESYEIVLQVMLPADVTGDNGGNPYEVTTVATSVSDVSVSNPMLNLLNNITGASVDITNRAHLNDAQATGVGTGPEPAPVTSVTVAADGTAAIDVYVNNTSAYPLDFNLSASIYSDFSSIELPESWQLTFYIADVATTSTGVIAPGEFVRVTARINMAGLLAPASTSIYFRADNEQYAIQDIKHDQIVVASQPGLLLGINQEAQTLPGGTHVFSHHIANTGNTDIANIDLVTIDSLAAQGWSSSVYEDTDGDGILSAGDQLVGSIGLLAGESKTLLVKVFAPASAADGQSNLTELSTTAGAEVLSVTDITNISSGEISVYKEQALDNGCDGILENSYSSSEFSVEPGNNCIRYRLTAFNNGSESVLNVVVADATPVFTTYTGNAICSQPDCVMAEPAIGSEGDIVASMPVLISGDSVVVEFMVRID